MTPDKPEPAPVVVKRPGTPLPWKCDVRVGMIQVYAGEERNCLATNLPVVFQVNGKWSEANTAWEIDPLAEANAAYIVEACNAYPALQTALKAAETQLAEATEKAWREAVKLYISEVSCSLREERTFPTVDAIVAKLKLEGK